MYCCLFLYSIRFSEFFATIFARFNIFICYLFIILLLCFFYYFLIIFATIFNEKYSSYCINFDYWIIFIWSDYFLFIMIIVICFVIVILFSGRLISLWIVLFSSTSNHLADRFNCNWNSQYIQRSKLTPK